MKNNDNSNMKKSILFMLIIIIVVAMIGVLAYFILIPDKESDDKSSVKNIGEIKNYGITISDNDTEAYKKEFEVLKANLESKEIDYDAYALSVAKMFVMDLYTINTKVNKYDVGGIEFVLPEKKENFSLNVTNTLYNYVEDNTKGKRSQNLPQVTSVDVKKSERKEYTIKGIETPFNAYVYNMNINYRIDLGYDKTVEVIMVNKDNHMYVVEKN